MDFAELNTYERDHLVEHLLDAGRQEPVHEILADFDQGYTWPAYRFAQEGNYAGYLRDLHYGRGTLDEKQAAHWPILIRYALSHSSVVARASNVSSRLMRLLLQEGLWTSQECLGTVRNVADNELATQSLIYLCRWASREGRHSERTDFAKEALLRIGLMESVWERALCLRRLLPSVPFGLHAMTFDVCRSVPHSGWQVLCLGELLKFCQGQLKKDVLKTALASMATQDGLFFHALSLSSIGAQMEGKGLPYLSKAIDIAKTEEDIYFQARLFGYIAGHLPVSLLESSWQYVREFPTLDRDTTGRWFARDYAIFGYAPAFVRQGLFERAREAIDRMSELGWYGPSMFLVGHVASLCPVPIASSLISILIARIRAEETPRLREEVLEILDRVGDRVTGRILRHTLKETFKVQVMDSWVDDFRTPEPSYRPLRGACVLASYLPPTESVRLMEHFLSRWRTRTDDAYVSKLAWLYTRAGFPEKAHSAIESSGSLPQKIAALLSMVGCSSVEDRECLLDTASRMTKRIEDSALRDLAYLRIAELEDTERRRKQLALLLQESNRIDDSTESAQFLKALDRTPEVVREMSIAHRSLTKVPVDPKQPDSVDQADAVIDSLRKRIRGVQALSRVPSQYDVPSPRDTEIAKLFEELVQCSMFEEAAQIGAMAVSIAFGSPSDYFEKLVDAGGFRAALDHFDELHGKDVLDEKAECFPAQYLPDLIRVSATIDQEKRGHVVAKLCDLQIPYEYLSALIVVILGIESAGQRSLCLQRLSQGWVDWFASEPADAAEMLLKAVWELRVSNRPDFFDALTSLGSVLSRVCGSHAEELRTIVSQCVTSWP